MDISNSLVPSGLRDSVNSSRSTAAEAFKNQERPNKQNAPITTFAPVARQTVSANPDILASKSNEFQQSRLQRLNALESAPIKVQEAFNRYQQTVEAGENFDQGELVGIDLFV